MYKRFQHFVITTCSIVLSFSTWGNSFVPSEWSGKFSVDNTFINHYRRTKDTSTVTAEGDQANQYFAPLDGSPSRISFQSYILRLHPQLIINDALTMHAEMTTGHASGGLLGDHSTYQKSKSGSPSYGNSLYYFNTHGSSANVILSQFYLNVFSDIFTLTLGRQPIDWGLGAIFSRGDERFDRFVTLFDGVKGDFKIGSITIAPFWGRIDSSSQLTSESQTKIYGLSFLYENIQNDLSFGALFSRKKSGTFSGFYEVKDDDGSPANANANASRVKMTNLFFKKKLGKFTFSTEIPLISGNIGNIFADGNNVKYKTNALLVESQYKFNDSWDVNLNLGQVKGEDGSQAGFEALFLNPNYQIANIMFRYNYLAADNASSESIYDSAVHNAKYLKLSGNYTVDQWNWNLGFIYAKANEVADSGETFDHLRNKFVSTSKKQSKDLGYEIDFNITYKWTPEMHLHGNLGYHYVGDFYAFNDTDNPINLQNAYMGQLAASLSF